MESSHAMLYCEKMSSQAFLQIKKCFCVLCVLQGIDLEKAELQEVFPCSWTHALFSLPSGTSGRVGSSFPWWGS